MGRVAIAINLITIWIGGGSGSNDTDSNDVVVSSELRASIQKVLERNKDLIETKDKNLDRNDTMIMRNDTGNHHPIKTNSYRTPLKLRDDVDKAIDRMLGAKVIENSRGPLSFSRKKIGTKGFCVDYRSLSEITRSNASPLPVIRDVLPILGNAVFRNYIWNRVIDKWKFMNKIKIKQLFVPKEDLFLLIVCLLD